MLAPRALLLALLLLPPPWASWALWGPAVSSVDPACPAGCSCRAWVERVHPLRSQANCSGLALHALPAHIQDHIASLEATFNRFESLPKDFFGEHKLKLSKVNLSNNSISTIDKRTFAVLPELWIMNLTGNRIEYLHHDTFEENHKLWYLILRSNNINIYDHTIFLSAPQLGKLDLSYNNIRELKESTFRETPNLVYLRLHNNQFKNIHSSWFSPLSKLERLFLEHNQLTHLNVDTFIHTPKLFELSLSWNNLVIPSDVPFLRLPNLEYYHLSGCDFGSLPTHMFALSPRVRMLWVDSNRLSSLSVEIFNYLESLIFLNACDNQLQCSCDLKAAWEVCRYRRISADVSCAYESLASGDGMEGGCAGRWDVLEELVCNATASASASASASGATGDAGGADDASLDPPEDVAQLAGYATLGAMLLLFLLAVAAFVYWKYRLRRPAATVDSHRIPYPDMMPLNDDRDDVA